MKKIPVLPTIQAAYLFVFTHLGAIIGLIWLPMVLVTVMGFFVEQRYYAAAADAFASNSFTSLGPAMLSMFCYFVAALLLYAVMYVPVIQLALGQRKEGAMIHFAFGPLEWRLFRAMLGLSAFLMIPILITAILATLPQLAGAGLMLPAAMIVIFLGIFYVALRFLFLLPAVAVSEEGPVLPRAWQLSAGNFWRILLVVLATAAPIALVAGIAETLLEGPQALIPSFTTSTAVAAAQLHSIGLNMPLSKGIEFLIAPLLLGLAGGASAAALSELRSGTLEA